MVEGVFRGYKEGNEEKATADNRQLDGVEILVQERNDGTVEIDIMGNDFDSNSGIIQNRGTGGSTSNNYNYTYSVETDCYTEGVQCPAGTFCQVEARDNWYPYDVSFHNRGRCLPYAPSGGACEMPFEGTTSYPRKADGSFFERSTLCEPSVTTCTGDHIFVLPPTCVRARDPSKGCMSTQRNGCAGRPSLSECPNDDFCFFPAVDDNDIVALASNSNSAEENNVGTTRMTQKKLEQCAALVTSFNGPNFGFTMTGGGLPDDSHIEAGDTKLLIKHAMEHGSMMAPNVQHVLEKLWPYPVCQNNIEQDSDDCTSFPLPVPARDDDGGIIDGKCLQFNDNNGEQVEVDCDSLNNPVDISGMTSGATDYHCTWAVLHTLSFNGGIVLTAAEKQAFGELAMYITGQFSCKVCRNNFVNILNHYPLPEGNIREDYARWIWQAHNNANEHSYATHSMNLMQVQAQQKESESGTLLEDDLFTQTRSNNWANPTYEHPWYMEFEAARRVWTGLDGLYNQYQ